MSITLGQNAVVAKGGDSYHLSSLFSVTAAASDPTYLILSGLDRNEYTATSNEMRGSISGNGNSLGFSYISGSGDSYTFGVVFTYQSASGRYYSGTYGYLDQLTYTASTNVNDNTCLSLFGTSSLYYANLYASTPSVLANNPATFSYDGSVSVVTEPSVSGATPTQASVASVCAAALSFVGKAWNMNGCWVLASDIAAEAGASLPLDSSYVGIGASNGQWLVAYNGPSSGNWQSLVTAGEMVSFKDGTSSGHITTVVSGSGSSAQVVDNIVYTYNGQIMNPANDGSASDVIIAGPHSASDEWAQVTPGSTVVIYELDPGPTMTTRAASALAGHSIAASSLVASVTDPGYAITQYQFYDPSGSIQLNGATNLYQGAGIYRVAAADLSKLTYVGSAAGNVTLTVWAYDGYAWSTGNSVTLTITPDITMTTQAASAIAGHSIAASSLIASVSDAGGTAITQYQFYDPSGSIQLNGATNLYQGAGIYRVAAADLSKLTYVGGTPGNVTLTVWAYDGYAWSAGNSVTVTTTPDITMTTQAASVVAGHSIAASSLIASVSDAGGTAITTYQFYDPSGSIQLNGATNLYQGAGVYRVAAADLSKLTYVGGSTAGSQTLTVWAYDGYAWSAGNSVTVTTTANTPTMTTQAASVIAGHSFSASSLITGASDPGGDAITTYQFYDPSGSIQLNGATNLYQQAGVYRVAAADLSKLTYAGGSTAGSQTLTVWAYDGYAWSAGNSVTVTTTANTPTMTTQAASVIAGHSFSASSLITGASDPGGDAITMYQFYEPSGSGIQLNGATNLYQGAGIYRVAAADLSKLTYVGGTPGSESVTVWACDSYGWSVGNTVTVTTTPDITLTTLPASVVAGQSIAASSLIGNVSDAGGTAITMYQFYEPSGSGIQLNGAANLYQGAGIYRVAATDLSKLTYVGSTPGSENLTIWAYDGYAWSAGNSVAVTTTSNGTGALQQVASVSSVTATSQASTGITALAPATPSLAYHDAVGLGTDASAALIALASQRNLSLGVLAAGA